MFNKKDLVKQIKYESVNSLISNAQAAGWSVGDWVQQPTKGTGSPSSPTAKTGPSKVAPSSQSSVSKLQQTLKSLPEKLNIRVNASIKKYFNNNFANEFTDFTKLNLKVDGQWWSKTTEALKFTQGFLNSLVTVNTSLNLGVDGLNIDLSKKMGDLLSDYKVDKRGKVLLPPDQLNSKANELNEIIEKIPSFYQSALTSLSSKYGTTISNDETLDDYSSSEYAPTSEEENELIKQKIKISDKDLALTFLTNKRNITSWIIKNFPETANEQSKIKAKFNEIKSEIDKLT